MTKAEMVAEIEAEQTDRHAEQGRPTPDELLAGGGDERLWSGQSSLILNDRKASFDVSVE
jgi:hypothetical protein